MHDIHFAIGEKIEDTYDQIRNQWWGTSESLHLDAWGILQCVDGYNVSLKTHSPAATNKKLFFVNFGGYDPNKFTELHENFFVIDENEADAKKQAKAKISHWHVPHTDNLLAVDDCINVNELLVEKGVFIHLDYTGHSLNFDFTCKYVPIGKL